MNRAEEEGSDRSVLSVHRVRSLDKGQRWGVGALEQSHGEKSLETKVQRQEYCRTMGAKAVGPAKALSADLHLIPGCTLGPGPLDPPEVRYGASSGCAGLRSPLQELSRRGKAALGSWPPENLL